MKKKNLILKKVPAHLKLEEWPISRPIPCERNSRIHSEEQLEQLAASIEEFGQIKPIIVDEKDEILAGHGTLAAMNRGGHSSVRVLVINNLSSDQKRAYRIADNRLALSSSWDEDILKLEMTELNELEFDLDLTGFSIPEIESLTVDLKKVKREKIQPLESQKGKKVDCPKCHHKFRVE